MPPKKTFVVVAGAGGRGRHVNGIYTRSGKTLNDRSTWKMVFEPPTGETPKIYYRKAWKINDHDDTGGWLYSVKKDLKQPPKCQWTTEGYEEGDANPAPRVWRVEMDRQPELRSTEIEISEYAVGVRVQRGPDWHYNNQDMFDGNYGTTVPAKSASSETAATSGDCIWVVWDGGTKKRKYRIGLDGFFDLRRAGTDLDANGPADPSGFDDEAPANALLSHGGSRMLRVLKPRPVEDKSPLVMENEEEPLKDDDPDKVEDKDDKDDKQDDDTEEVYNECNFPWQLHILWDFFDVAAWVSWSLARGLCLAPVERILFFIVTGAVALAGFFLVSTGLCKFMSPNSDNEQNIRSYCKNQFVYDGLQVMLFSALIAMLKDQTDECKQRTDDGEEKTLIAAATNIGVSVVDMIFVKGPHYFKDLKNVKQFMENY